VSKPAAYFTDDGKNVSVTLESAQEMQAWVDYDGRTKVLNMTIAHVSMTSRLRRPLISHIIDVLPIFKQEMYVSFSAATGKLASSHYFLAWSFRTGGPARAIDLTRLPRVPKRPATAPSRSTVIKIIAVSCVVTLTVIVAVIVLALWLRRRAVLAETLEEWELDQPHMLPYKDLYKATKGFKATELLGASGFGQVYRGVLRRSQTWWPSSGSRTTGRRGCTSSWPRWRASGAYVTGTWWSCTGGASAGRTCSWSMTSCPTAASTHTCSASLLHLHRLTGSDR
jgi:hypothetical protein